MFMPGVPEIWYLDLFAGTNDHEAAAEGGHKEINRTNLSMEEIQPRLQMPVVQRQLELLRFRNTFPAFGFDSHLVIDDSDEGKLNLVWTRAEHQASLTADLATFAFEITYSSGDEVNTLSI
jgi:sucrose phosphorylase